MRRVWHTIAWFVIVGASVMAQVGVQPDVAVGRIELDLREGRHEPPFSLRKVAADGVQRLYDCAHRVVVEDSEEAPGER